VLAYNLGRIEEAIGFYRRAVEQDPLSTSTYTNLAVALHAADRLTEAEAAYRKALELAPQRVNTRAFLSLTLLAQGRADEALVEAMREPNEQLRLWALAIVHHALGHGAESEAALRGLIEASDVWALQVAQVHGARGEADAAFEWLERAREQRDPGLPGLKSDAQLRSLHGDARWGMFLKKMGLED
jgi:tetratricopeptide (TPR) repeat protein